MAISAGTQLGPYEIFSQIGAGGMGEVYKARDTRLDRVFALKLLTCTSQTVEKLHYNGLASRWRGGL